ncbi:MAG: low temperature requirement protein A [Cypionkella sp.]|nr:low temperature requirement protein A [Cypionkella sp.]MDZ4395396.1 low temperature requirement protein A [Cypionkella sp.]
MAVIRAGYMALVFRGQRMGQNYAQLCAWSAISGLFWVAGAVLPEQRVWLWIVAVLLDYAAPYHGFWLPRFGATPMQSWPLRGLHLLERNQQVFIIALGESVLLLGGLLVEHPLQVDVLVAAGLGFMLILSLWWIYFVHLSEAGEHGFAHSSDHTKLARAGLAYAHGVMVCGAIVVAVAIEMIVAHPLESVHAPVALIATAGPAIFLAGSRTMAQKLPFSYLAAVLGLAVWGGLCLMLHLNGLWLGAGVLAVMLALASFAHGKADA